MATPLQERIKQSKEFDSLAEEALLGLVVAAADVRDRTSKVCRQFGLSESQYNVLRILRGAPANGYPRGEIIDRMLDPSPDVTRLIDGLSDSGFVERKRCVEDRRRVMHFVTDKGRALVDEMADDIRSVHRCFAGRLDGDDELCELIRLCAKIYDAEASS